MNRLVAVVGPTASGKSAVALKLAERLGGAVLSVDSMQVYRGMDIGTAKPAPIDQARIVHHMIDLVEPDVDYTVAEFQKAARACIGESGGPVVIAGGSGLHFRAVVDPLEFPPTDQALRARLEDTPHETLRREVLEADPEAGEHLDVNNPRRVVRAVEILRITGLTPTERASTEPARSVREYRPFLEFSAFGLDPGERLGERISRRLSGMREGGLIEEVERLAPRLGRTAAQAVGYKELLGVVAGSEAVEAGFAKAEAATMALARSQRTYFRRDPRIRWLPWQDDPERLCEQILSSLEP